MAKIKDLNSARKNKNDEFYTQLSDVQSEMSNYTHHFKDKVVYCNCNDTVSSAFFNFFYNNFDRLGLKKLITTTYCEPNNLYNPEFKTASFFVSTGNRDTKKYLQGDGDFRSTECVKLLKEADIVCTNPPFSLFRKYVDQLIEYDKKFLIIGDQNAITYKNIFPLIQNNKIWLGHSGFGNVYQVPDHYEINSTSGWIENGKRYLKVKSSCWFTNLEHDKRNDIIELHKKYNERDYPHYEEYDAINVNKTSEIPVDWDGVMGVPISFLNKYNPEQFKILGLDSDDGWGGKPLKVNGKYVYRRIFIRRADFS